MIVRELFSFTFGAVEMFFSCTLYDITIILCCLLGFRPSLDRSSTLLKMIEDVTKKGLLKYRESCSRDRSAEVAAVEVLTDIISENYLGSLCYQLSHTILGGTGDPSR